MSPNYIDPQVHDYMMQASRNLFNAAQSGDKDLAEATLVNLQSTLPSYLSAIREDNRGNPI